MSVLSQIDATLAALLPAVAQQQDGYFATNGVYYQMLWTHAEPPIELTAPDNLSAVPVGQAPAPVAGLPATMRSRMRIDTYGKPDGWMMTLEASVDGTVWRKQIDCGVRPEWSGEWHIDATP